MVVEVNKLQFLNTSTEITDFGKKLIILECDDGNTYYHTDVK